MVRVFSMYHFEKQVVDTIDDMCAVTMTLDNKLLIAKSNYTIEVRDSLSETKGPLFSFPSIDKVEIILHSICGNYVATLERKQTDETSSSIIRIYTNWSADFVVNECKKSNKLVEHFVRPRIAGLVTPASAKADDDYLDMIEIRETFAKESVIACCQRTGKLGAVIGQTFRLYNQVYQRNHGARFMDFIPFIQVYQFSFVPHMIRIDGYVVSACNQKMVVVFDLVKKFKGKNVEKAYGVYDAVSELSSDEEEELVNEKCSESVVASDGALHLDNFVKIMRENKENHLKRILGDESFPVTVHVRHINDGALPNKQRKFPFEILKRIPKPEVKNGKMEDTCVDTLSCDNDYVIVARTLLALHFDCYDDSAWKISTQLVLKNDCDFARVDSRNPAELFSVDNIVCFNFLVTTYQEGFLFYLTPLDPQVEPECACVFSFTSPIVDVAFKSCFLHVLTDVGLETYNVPTYRSLILDEKTTQFEGTKHISIFGMQPFINVTDLYSSTECITLFTSANDHPERNNFPRTVYCLKLRKTRDIYDEIMDTAAVYKTQDEEMYRYLTTEACLVLHAKFRFESTSAEIDDFRNWYPYVKNSTELAISYFGCKTGYSFKMGTKLVLGSNLDPIDFAESFENDTNAISEGIVYLVTAWLKVKRDYSLTQEQVERVIRIYEKNEAANELATFLLRNENACRLSGHKAIQCLKKNARSSERNWNIRVLYALCVLYTQQCLQEEAVELLNLVRKNRDVRAVFVKLISKYWIFLFEKNSNNNKESIDFSDMTSLLIEIFPSDLSAIFAELILTRKRFTISEIVQMLLKQFPCRVSMRKGHTVLQKLLELIFSRKQMSDLENPPVNNCLKILVRSYLTQLPADDANRGADLPQYVSVFDTELPDYVNYLPAVENCDSTILRKLQELIWNKLLKEETVREISESLPSVEFKLNILGLMNYFDFVKELLKYQYVEAIFPYAKLSFDDLKKWRDLIGLLRNRITESENSKQNCERYENALRDILDHISETMTPSQLNAVLEPVIQKSDEMYRKSLIKAQQISYANEVKETIVDTTEQILYTNTFV